MNKTHLSLVPGVASHLIWWTTLEQSVDDIIWGSCECCPDRALTDVSVWALSLNNTDSYRRSEAALIKIFNWWLSNQLTAMSLNREIILVSTNSNSVMISGRFQDKYICYVVALKSVFAPWWQLSETRTPAALRHPSAIIPTVNLWGCHAISQRLPEQKLIFYRSPPGNRDIPITSLFLDQLWELSFTSCHLSAAQSIPRLNVFAPAGKNAAARLSADRSLIFRNNNQGHKVPERFVPEPFCWGKRAVITGILCESEDLFQLHSDSSSHQPLSACLHLQRSLIKTRKARVPSED